MNYTHINNKDVFKKGKVDGKHLYLKGRTYKIVSFELATGNFIVEENKNNPF